METVSALNHRAIELSVPVGRNVRVGGGVGVDPLRGGLEIGAISSQKGLLPGGVPHMGDRSAIAGLTSLGISILPQFVPISGIFPHITSESVGVAVKRRISHLYALCL